MLVLQSATQGTGGEIFVLDMGQPIKIVDLARQMIELSGLKPDEDIQIEFTGVRPGEKLFEEVTRKGENFASTTHPKIFRFLSHPANLEEIRKTLQNLRENLHEFEADGLKLMLKAAMPDYQPGPALKNRIIPCMSELEIQRSQLEAAPETGKRHWVLSPESGTPNTAPLD